MKLWLLCILFLPSIAQVAVAHARFCAPLTLPEPGQKVERIKPGDVQSLFKTLHRVAPGTTILLADGIYTLAANQALEVNTPRVTLGSASGNRDAVIIEGGYNNVSINTDDVTVANLTLRNPKFHNIQVRGEKGLQGTKIYNVHLVDLTIRPIHCPYREFQAVGRETHPTRAVAGFPAALLTKASTGIGGLPLRLS